MSSRLLRKTKVIATIGPACESIDTLKAMIHAGMNVARLNFSHGTHEEHRKRLEAVREAAQALDANVAVMLDTKGVEIRTGRVEGGAVNLTTGQSFALFDSDHVGDTNGVSLSEPEIFEHVHEGSRILLDDGVIELRVVSATANRLECQITRGGRLQDRRGVNVPGATFEHRPMSRENREDLLFAIDHDIEYIAASFVHSARDIAEIRKLLEDHGAQIPIIAKIENKDAVRNLEEIVAAASGIMVARGDLGVEMPLAEVPIVQKKIIRTTVGAGKAVITATQMLDSMERNPIPTRAEVSDVANAILDGTSAVMLSGETAVGAYPVEAVRTMASLAREAEGALSEYGDLQNIRSEPAHVVTEAVSQAAITMADHLEAAAILTLTESGFTSRSISKYRPRCPILAISASQKVVRKLALNWGVNAIRYEAAAGHDARERNDEDMIRFGIHRALELGYVQRGDVVVATAGVSRRTGSTNMIRVIEVD
jgi:pyruvate kinase